MKRFFIFLLFVSAALFPAVCPAAAADPVVNIGGVRIRKVLFAVSPADRQECMHNKESWGLKHCLSGGRDYLAGAAKACGGLQNLPTGKEAKELAVLLYGDDRGKDAFTVRATTGCLNKSACLRHMIIFTFGWQTKRPTAKAVTSACLPTKAPFPTMPVATARGMFLPASD